MRHFSATSQTPTMDADDLALNIVVQPVEPKVKEPPKKKKMNKYEKRRQKFKKAAEKKSETNVEKKTPARQEPKEDTGDQQMSNTSEKEHKEPIEHKPEPQSPETSPEQTTVANTETLPEDKEARAAYLREFHARPAELDRRSGARKKVTESKPSDHLFGTTQWQDFGLDERLLQRLPERPTSIQVAAIPAILNKAANCTLIQAETGSGKTLAFGLPLLHAILPQTKTDRSTIGTRSLVIAPTRELAVQTASTLSEQAPHSLVVSSVLGQENRSSEKARLRKGVACLVATPGRLLDHVQRTQALRGHLSKAGPTKYLVLDEADRLLDMGLGPVVSSVVQELKSLYTDWRCIAVSATATPAVKEWLKSTWDGELQLIQASREKRPEADDALNLYNSTPQQLVHQYMQVTAKWRLAALVACCHRTLQDTQRTVVFMDTCATVDYHCTLLTQMFNIVSNDEDDKGIFGKQCTFFRLHGNVPHAHRHDVLKRFAACKTAAILFCTDVAARGLNLPATDWTIQYDPPSEVADYVHRAGRVARAGKAGHALVFLLPSEKDFLHVLKQRGVPKLQALSLTSILNDVAEKCPSFTEAGMSRSGSRAGEAFSLELQNKLEEMVHETPPEEDTKGKNKRKRKSGVSPLLEMAQVAFLSHIRAYPTREKVIRSIFSAKALHLGHVARSFALKEPPTRLAKKSTRREEENDEDRYKRQKRMAFDHEKQTKTDTRKARDVLLDNASKLENMGMNSF